MRVQSLLAGVILLVAACETGSSNDDDDDDDDDDVTVDGGSSGGADAAPGTPDGAPGGPDGGGNGGSDAGPSTPPTWSSELGDGEDLWGTHTPSGGDVGFGVAEPTSADNAIGVLRLPGNPAFGPQDHAYPAYATEIEADRIFGYGDFRARVSMARCAADEDAVSGYFLYQNDGGDHDGDGLVDNNEIDIEILCANPSVIHLSVWTDYTSFDGGAFRKVTHSIDLETGDLWESPSDHELGLEPAGNDPALHRPGWPDEEAFYELGFDWHADHIRFFLVDGDQELTLWNLTEADRIPSHEMYWLFNLWHSPEHWFSPVGEADYPAEDAFYRIDWARYWAE
jgi:hypothetical protein